MKTAELQELVDYLQSRMNGSISDTDKIESLLAACWDDFEGADLTAMDGYKLSGRMKHVLWIPPVLEFTIARHGGTVLGSSREEIHRWTVNVETMSAVCAAIGHKQVRANAAKFDVECLVEEIVQKIFKGEADKFFVWREDGCVKINVSDAVPPKGVAKQTLSGRRKRFRAALKSRLQESGLSEVALYTFRPSKAE